MNTSSPLPENGLLRSFLKNILARHGQRIAFVVLFGSRARGDWLPGSDYDVLIGLGEDDGKRLIDRMYEFSLEAPNEVEVFPYGFSEWKRMFATRHLLMLEVLAHGVVLFDQGDFARMREVFGRWREEGSVIPAGYGWRIKV